MVKLAEERSTECGLKPLDGIGKEKIGDLADRTVRLAEERSTKCGLKPLDGIGKEKIEDLADRMVISACASCVFGE